jgi:hypothetical protein
MKWRPGSRVRSLGLQRKSGDRSVPQEYDATLPMIMVPTCEAGSLERSPGLAS